MKRTIPTLGRMLAVQDPVIPIVAELTRANPGTISLGQGMVNYAPPPEVAAAVTSNLSEPANHKYVY